jgi:ribosomal protein S3
LSYIEYILSSQVESNVRLFSWKTKDEKKKCSFIVEQIVYFFYKRVPFHRIKQQIWRQLKLKSIQGIRITYSGRLGGRSKKAQRSRRKLSMGSSIISCFESKMSFASQYALTILEKLELKFGLL